MPIQQYSHSFDFKWALVFKMIIASSLFLCCHWDGSEKRWDGKFISWSFPAPTPTRNVKLNLRTTQAKLDLNSVKWRMRRGVSEWVKFFLFQLDLDSQILVRFHKARNISSAFMRKKASSPLNFSLSAQQCYMFDDHQISFHVSPSRSNSQTKFSIVTLFRLSVGSLV